MDISSVKIGFLGFGNMATAMAKGWIASGKIAPTQLFASSGRFDVLQERTQALGISACASNTELVSSVDVVVLAVKPYLVESVLKEVAKAIEGKVVISVAVNLSSQTLKGWAPECSVLAVLPNTPVAINEGIVLCEQEDALVSDAQREDLFELLRLLGRVVRLPSAQLKVGGILSGCGPAYAAMVIEGLADGAVRSGLPRAVAYELASQMLVGTAQLQLATGAHPGAMKDAVCSPGGTTIEGVAVLERRGLRSALIDAVEAVATR